MTDKPRIALAAYSPDARLFGHRYAVLFFARLILQTCRRVAAVRNLGYFVCTK